MSITNQKDFVFKKGDALLIVDLQNDFLPGGSLTVPGGDRVVKVFNKYIAMFKSKDLPVFASRDWHPPNHSSFKEQGGPWPAHCVAGTDGARFASGLHIGDDTIIISKAIETEGDSYSMFEKTGLNEQLRSRGIDRLLIGGLATDYCVINTVRDAVKLGYRVLLLEDAISAVDVHPGDGDKAIEEMVNIGALPVSIDTLS